MYLEKINKLKTIDVKEKKIKRYEMDSFYINQTIKHW
jgi:hypothetical protein